MSDTEITNSDLLTKIFPEEILVKNIDHLSLMTIIKTQKNLSKQFINNYIFNDKYIIFPEDDISYSDLITFQPQYYK